MSRTRIGALCALAIALPALTLAAPHTLRVVEDAAETVPLDLVLTAPDAGRINARLCDRCELLTLTVDADTAVLLHGARKTLQDAKDRGDRGATVIFDRESKIVRRIVLWD
jgi:hypothetical protein